MEKEFKKYFREQAIRETILKYLFVKSLEEEYDFERIAFTYRINPEIIIKAYNGLNKEESSNIENEIIEKINKGEIDLKHEAARWHKQGLKESQLTEQAVKGQKVLKARQEKEEETK